jgi:hypothetical protein
LSDSTGRTHGGRARAIDKGERYRKTGESNVVRQLPRKRKGQDDHAIFVGECRLRGRECERRRGLDENVGRHERLPCSRRHGEGWLAGHRRGRDLLDGKAGRAAVAGHLGGVAIDEIGLGRGLGRAGREVERELDRVGHADVAADQDIKLGGER